MSSFESKLVPTTTAGNLATEPVELDSSRTSFGRGRGNSVMLADREVSKEHAEIFSDGSMLVLRDLGSSNGTFVNGKRISEKVLKDGDTVSMGLCEYIVDGSSSFAVTIAPDTEADRTQVLMSSPLRQIEAGGASGGDGTGTGDGDHNDLAADYERVRSAFAAVQELIETRDIHELCERIIDVAFGLLQADSGAVLLFDGEHNLNPWATRNDGPGDGNIVISKTIVDRVIDEKAALIANDALKDSRWSSSESVVISGVRSLLCVPLLNGDQIFGILHVGNTRAAGLFGRTDLELISGIGHGAGVALANAFMLHRLAEESKHRESLERFLSPQLVEQVLAQKLKVKRGGDVREVSVMFADIRGFTSLTEKTPAVEVVHLLNEYFDRMVDVVFEYGGILDKFIGDAVMAVWGIPIGGTNVGPGDASSTIKCAEKMMLALAQLNEVRSHRGEEPFCVGIGIASGPCVAGAIGARRRMEYTVIGDAVNIAARLSGVAKPSEILFDDASYMRAKKPRAAEFHASLKVKGRDAAVEVWSIDCDAT